MSHRRYANRSRDDRTRDVPQPGFSRANTHPYPARDGTATAKHIRNWAQLEGDLLSIDKKQYGAYHRIQGRYSHQHAPTFDLHIDHIQGDPFAPPSRVRAVMRFADTGFPSEYLASDIHKTALCDYVTRQAAATIRQKQLDQNLGGGKGSWSGPKGGAFDINKCGQEMLPRTSALISSNADTIELRFMVSLPAAGRIILGQKAFHMLSINIVHLVEASLLYQNLDQSSLRLHVVCAANQHHLRQQAQAHGLIAFVANDSILPRISGASQSPMSRDTAIPFKAPKELEISLELSDGSSVVGMGVPRGITLLTGGGFHGKSTLLSAIEHGVYNQIPGDGREFVVTDPNAMKVRAEDGRSVTKVDISPFISELPGGKDTHVFSTEDASGSTSMATNIQEALEAGCQTLLIDEDSSATNLLVRDQRMQMLVRHEPIKPFITKARALFSQHGVSTIIVIGGLGDWLSVADNVINMEHYIPRSIGQEVDTVIKQFPSVVPQSTTYGAIPSRSFRVDLTGYRDPFVLRKAFITMNRQDRETVDDIPYGEMGIELGALDHIVEIGQTRMLAHLIQRIATLTRSGKPLTLSEITSSPLFKSAIGIDDCLSTGLPGGQLVAVRPLELLAALSRLRGLILKADTHPPSRHARENDSSS